MSKDYDVIFDPDKGFLGKNADTNIEKLIASIISYAKHKKGIYEANSPEKDLKVIQQDLKSSLTLLEEQKKNTEDYLMRNEKTAEAITSKIVEQNSQKYITTIENISKFRAKVAANDQILQKYCIEYPKNPSAIIKELKTNIEKAVVNLRKEISGTAPQTVKYRRMIEEIVVKFGSSWGSFKNSYVLNYCLRGGAGVGKTTFAKAVAKCISAYGILATDYIKLADKTDFIAQYLGQTVYKTSNTLYSSIEGVCFIDEAYAIGATRDYGGEFIDELTLFTQKFPGCICIIVAGYEKEMKKHFFDMNEGLYRRFPNNLELRPYDINTINSAIVSKIASKLEITNIESVKNAIAGHQTLVSYLYMDVTTPAQYTLFNLAPFITAIMETPSIEKRNILKAYILKTHLGIPEGDLLPNQMGDVQNIVDKILMTQSLLETGNVTARTAIENINAFLAIRNVAKFYYDVSNGVTYLTTNSMSPKLFTTNVTEPLFINIYGSHENYNSLLQNKDTNSEAWKVYNTNIDKLYTDAVAYMYSYAKAVDAGTEKIKVSTHVDIQFLNQEFLTLDSLLKTNPKEVLHYVDIQKDSSETSALATLENRGVGTFTIPKPKTIQQSCDAGVPVVATSDPANNDGSNPLPISTAPPSGKDGRPDWSGYFTDVRARYEPSRARKDSATEKNTFLDRMPEPNLTPEERQKFEQRKREQPQTSEDVVMEELGGKRSKKRSKPHGTYRSKHSSLYKTYRTNRLR